jgi:hypothetical protein
MSRFMRRRQVTIDGNVFEVSEVSIAMRREIETAQKAGGDLVEETLRRCVWFDGKLLGDEVRELGFSYATPLTMAIQEMASEGVPIANAEPAPDPAPAVSTNGHAEAPAAPKV